MQPETKPRDPGIDEGTGLPSGKVFLALAALGLFLLLLAALSSGRAASEPPQVAMATKAIEVLPAASRGFGYFPLEQ